MQGFFVPQKYKKNEQLTKHHKKKQPHATYTNLCNLW
jgi:hypothetical protein